MGQPESRLGLEQPGGQLRVDHRVLQGTGVEVAMTLRGMALRRLDGLASAVAGHFPHPGAAQDRSRGALARVLAMREAQLAPAGGAASPRFAFDGCVACHHLKRTASRANERGAHLMTASVSIVDRLRAAVLDPRDVVAAIPDGLRPASVLLLCDPATPGVPLLFLLRSEDLREHPGQIAFPGGGRGDVRQ